MSAAKTADPSLPPRRTSAGHLLGTLYLIQLRQLITARKTVALSIVALLPVLGALIFVVFQDVDGLSMFNGVISTVFFPFIIPLIAIFYGGPVIVDEMEGRTLTYLTLRPVPRPIIYLGKMAAGLTLALGLTLLPLLLLFVVSLAGSGDMSGMFEALGKLSLGASLGVLAYGAIFTALGAAFASSLLSGIVYFVVFELVLASLPLLELASVRYHIRTAAGLKADERLGALDQLVLDEPIVLQWWVGALIAALLAVLVTALGAWLFQERQYNV